MHFAFLILPDESLVIVVNGTENIFLGVYKNRKKKNLAEQVMVLCDRAGDSLRYTAYNSCVRRADNKLVRCMACLRL